MNILKKVFFGGILFTASFANDTEKSLKLDLQTDLQMIKKLDENVRKENIDDMFLRMKFMLSYENPSYKSVFRLRFLPAGYGNTVLTSAEIDGSGELESKSSNLLKTQVIRTFIESKDKAVNFIFGRFGAGSTYGVNFGDYLEERSGASFMIVPRTVNGLELFVKNSTGYRSGLLLEIGDNQFNTGSLRFESTMGSLKSEGAFGKIGWRGNVIDPIQDEKRFSHTAALGCGFTFNKSDAVFAELGAININQEGNRLFPVTVGYQLGLPAVIDKVIFEAEYEKENEHPIAGGVHFSSALDDYFAVNFAVYNTGAQKKYRDSFELALRLSGYLVGKKGWIF